MTRDDSQVVELTAAKAYSDRPRLVLTVSEAATKTDDLAAVLNRIDDPSVRKIVIMSKWERGEITPDRAERLIRELGLEAA